jgi:gliding motility-associated-like protein
MKKIFTLLFISLTCTYAKAQVVINEYSCSNLNSYADAFGQFEDYIELYNAGGAPVVLDGYWLSDDPNDIQKFQIPTGVTINAGARRMVFCSDRGILSGTQIHTSFKLKQTYGEKFIIADPAGNVIDSTTMFLTTVGHSRGRTTDGAATWSLFTTPTPNAANAGGLTGYATKPIFDIQPGNYTTPQNISITSPDPNVTIYYTTNGTTPTTASTVYTGPINVAATTVIKARAYSSNPAIAPSFVETNTYFINETTTVNILSVTGTLNNLFTGGQQQYASLEYFDKTHTFKYEAEGQMRRHGNDSWAYPQKGMRFHVRDESGITGDINYPLFTATPKDTFGVIIIKAAGSDNFDGGPFPAAHIRDAFAQTLADRYDLEMDLRRYEPTILFINGQYWGLYEIRERVDDSYTEYNYNQPEKKIDMLRYWGGLNVEYGSDTGWNNLYNYIMANNMAIPANYAHAESFLNMSSFIEYFIFNQYLVNTDWLNWNTMWWRGRKGQGVKWRYILWDEDNILNLGQNYTGVGNTGANNNPCDPMSLFQGNAQIKHTDMLVRLLQNPDFKALYDQTWIDMLNGVFKCENILYHYDSIHAIIQPEMQRQCTRWGANYAQWQANILTARQFLIDRCALIQGKLDTCLDLQMANLKWAVSPAGVGDIDMNGTGLNPIPGQKLIKADTTYILEAFSTTPNWIFDHWEKTAGGNSYIVNNTDNPVTYDFNEDDSITAVFVYFNPDSIEVTFDVDPVLGGTIALDGNVIPTYPTTIKLNRNITYNLTAATPHTNWYLQNWEKKRTTSNFAPDNVSTTVAYTFSEKDTVIAHFHYIPDPDSIDVTFDVDPATKGEIILNGVTIPTYPTTIKLDRTQSYSLLAQPTAQFHRFVNWTKTDGASNFAPSDTLTSTTYTFQNTDYVVAHFVKYPDPDSVYVIFDVYPPGKGTIDLNGDRITAYPYKVKLYRQYAYDLVAKPIFDWKFIDWTNAEVNSTFANSKQDPIVVYRYKDVDSVVANFTQLPPPVDETIMIPTAFSPNFDGRNDVFRVIPGKDVSAIDIRIFNRFGELVFQTTDVKQGWDGIWKGQPGEVGVYFYQIKAEFDNKKGSTKEKLYKGDLTLVR